MTYQAAGDGACAMPERISLRFGERLRAARLTAGFSTARQFAFALGLAENRYTRYERGETEPDLGTIARICVLLGVRPDDLLGFAVASDTAAFTPGFAEAPTDRGPDANPDARDADRQRAGRRRWLGWQLAHICADDETPDQIAQLRRTCELLRQIEHDPLGFIAATLETTDVDRWSPDRQRRLALAIDALCAALAEPSTTSPERQT